jgi:hypothetical protein
MARIYRADRIRTCDLSHPRRTLYQAEPQPELRVVEKFQRRTDYFAHFGGSSKLYRAAISREAVVFSGIQEKRAPTSPVELGDELSSRLAAVALVDDLLMTCRNGLKNPNSSHI